MTSKAVWTFAIVALCTAGGVLAQSSPDYTKSMENLLAAAQQVREAIQDAAQQEPGAKRERAIEEAHEALLETQRAMFALPPELRSGRGAAAAGGTYEAAIAHLREAADRLRESVQAMAQQKAGPGRSQAMEQANAALLETYDALAAVRRSSSAAAGSSQAGSSQEDKSWVEKSSKTYDERTDTETDTKSKRR